MGTETQNSHTRQIWCVLRRKPARYSEEIEADRHNKKIMPRVATLQEVAEFEWIRWPETSD